MLGRRVQSLTVSLVVAVLAGFAVPGGAHAAAAPGSGVAEQTVDCEALEQEQADFNAGLDQVRAAIQASNIPQAQKDAAIAQLEAIRAQGNAQFELLLVAGGCQPPPPVVPSCAEQVQQRAAFNAGVDQSVAVIQASNIPQAQKDAAIAQLEAVRAATNAFFDRLFAVSGCSQPPVCASPPAPPAGAIIAQPGTVTFGTSGNDVIYGTAGDDRIAGLGGDDQIFGLSGNDQITGGPGHDVICGGDGNDKLVGDAGADILSGDAGDDDLSGGADDDRLVGGPGTNRLAGGDGSDTCAPFGTPASQTAGCESVLPVSDG